MNTLRLQEFTIEQSLSTVYISYKGKAISGYNIDVLIEQNGNDFVLHDGTIMTKDLVEIMALYLINMKRLPKSKGGLL